jgi:hypothetical protein
MPSLLMNVPLEDRKSPRSSFPGSVIQMLSLLNAYGDFGGFFFSFYICTMHGVTIGSKDKVRHKTFREPFILTLPVVRYRKMQPLQ